MAGTTVDQLALQLRIERGETALAYAVARAIRDTAIDVQEAVKADVRGASRIHIRNQSFLLGGGARRSGIIGKIEQFPSRGSLTAIVALQGSIKSPRVSATGSSGLLFGFLESGKDRPGEHGRRIAVPVPGSSARPSPSLSIDPALRITKLFKSMRKPAKPVAGKLQVLRGAKRTFLIPGQGIFLRFGPGEFDTEKIYAFPPRIHIPNTLHFRQIAKTTVAKVMPLHLLRWIKEAIAWGNRHKPVNTTV